ncbi:MAG: hypothetical protein HFG76_01360 [Hungatella sp.]|nr:hypothetical protein [Hungatella sp.]
MRIVEITMEKRTHIAMGILVDEKDLKKIKSGEYPFLDVMKRELDSGEGYVEYDYAVADERGNTIIDWRSL